jgi:hypothetical protein
MDYFSELGQNIPKVMDELCANAKVNFEKEHQIPIQMEQNLKPPSFIDSSSDGKSARRINSDPEEFKIKLEDLNIGPSSSPDNSFESTILAEHEDYASLLELLDCLNKDELQSLAKSMRLDITGKVIKLVRPQQPRSISSNVSSAKS